MADKGVNIPVKVEGVDQAKQEFDALGNAVGDLNRAQQEFFETAQMGKEAADGLTSSFDQLNQAEAESAQSAAAAAQDQQEFSEYLRQTAQDAQDFQEYLDSAKDSADSFGDAAQQAGDTAGEGMDKAAKKASILDRIINGVQSSAIRMVVGFLGIQGVLKLVDALRERLEKIQEIQKELADKSIEASKVGQSIETATGTVGRQDVWTRKALALQGAGGLDSIDAAAALMSGLQGATAGVGGIRNPVIAAMLQRLAPKLGASGKSAGDISAIFEAAAKEGVGPEGLESFLSRGLGISDSQASAYLQSPLGRSRSGAAKSALGEYVAAASTVEWESRLSAADSTMKQLIDTGQEKWYIPNAMEKIMIAFDSLRSEINAAASAAADPDQRARLMGLSNQLSISDPYQAKTPLLTKGAAIETEFRGMTINNNYQNITNHNPIVAPDAFRRGGRVDPNDI